MNLKEKILKALKKIWFDALILTMAILLYLYHRWDSMSMVFQVSIGIFLINFVLISLIRNAWETPTDTPGEIRGGGIKDKMKQLLGGTPKVEEGKTSEGRSSPEVVLLK